MRPHSRRALPSESQLQIKVRNRYICIYFVPFFRFRYTCMLFERRHERIAVKVLTTSNENGDLPPPPTTPYDMVPYTHRRDHHSLGIRARREETTMAKSNGSPMAVASVRTTNGSPSGLQFAEGAGRGLENETLRCDRPVGVVIGTFAESKSGGSDILLLSTHGRERETPEYYLGSRISHPGSRIPNQAGNQERGDRGSVQLTARFTRKKLTEEIYSLSTLGRSQTEIERCGGETPTTGRDVA